MKIEDNILKFQEYLANERRYPETTINSYDNDLSNKYVTFLKKHPEINYKKITKEEIRILLKEETEANSSKSSISRMLSALRHFYTYLEIHCSIYRCVYFVVEIVADFFRIPCPHVACC